MRERVASRVVVARWAREQIETNFDWGQNERRRERERERGRAEKNEMIIATVSNIS